FRRWLLRPNCPPLLKVLRQLLDKAFGLNKDNRTHAHWEECEEDIRIHAGHGKYYGIPSAPGKGNSFVCFYPGGNRQFEWVAGQIKFIFKQDGEIRFAVRRSLSIAFDMTAPDPFRKFWDQGFQAKTVSSNFSSELEFVKTDWLSGHIARWELNSSQVVCLNL
ncbi:hypothetical protein F5051DRAFT_310857, partial [Lentinula edodes]